MYKPVDDLQRVKRMLRLVSKEGLTTNGKRLLTERIRKVMKQQRKEPMFTVALVFKEGDSIPQGFRGLPGTELDSSHGLSGNWGKEWSEGGGNWTNSGWANGSTTWRQQWGEEPGGWSENWKENAPPGGHEESWRDSSDGSWAESWPDTPESPRPDKVDPGLYHSSIQKSPRFKLADFTEEERLILKRIGIE